MQILRMYEDWNKIDTREELIERLKKYEGILSGPMISYLKSLIDLEFSIIRDYIGEEERKALSELEIYKRIAMYNIYCRALNLFNEKDPGLRISGNNDGKEGLEVYASLGERGCTLFDFNYREGPMGFVSSIPKGYKTTKIGEINLFQTFENKEQREAELNRVMSMLERLYDEKNPYSSRPHTYGGPAPQWAFEHSSKIKDYEKRFALLDSKKDLTDEEIKEIEMTQKYHALLLEDYGLTEKDFVEDKGSSVFRRENTKLNKTLVKRMPGLTIRDNTKYI